MLCVFEWRKKQTLTGLLKLLVYYMYINKDFMIIYPIKGGGFEDMLVFRKL